MHLLLHWYETLKERKNMNTKNNLKTKNKKEKRKKKIKIKINECIRLEKFIAFRRNIRQK